MIGTVAFTEPDDRSTRMIERGGERVRIAVDVRDGVVATAGWLSSTSIAAPDAVAALARPRRRRLHLHERGSRRHACRGPTSRRSRACREAARGGPVIYSGGIGDARATSRRSRRCRRREMSGVIVGKALYERRFSITRGARWRCGEERRMSVLKRVIPCLDVDKGRVVKGTNFVGLRDAGDPVELAERYDAEGADELVFLDITASHEQRETIVQLARRTADNVFIPFTIGGGIRSREDAQAVLDAGADKVSVNSAAVARPELMDELADTFGAQCVVLAIDAGRARR